MYTEQDKELIFILDIGTRSVIGILGSLALRDILLMNGLSP